jgi:hypothetical protein
VVRAVEPSNVQWRNFGHGAVSLLLRRGFTTLFSFVMLCISAALLYFANRAKRAEIPQTCAAAVCAAALDAVGDGDGTSDVSQLLEDYGAFAAPPVAPFNLTCAGPNTIVYFRPGASIGDDGLCIGAGSWCLGELPFDEMLSEDVICSDAIDNYFSKAVLTWIPTLAVPIINAVLKAVLRTLVKLEKHTNISSEGAAIAVKLFMVTFMNTSLLVFLMSTKNINTAINTAVESGFGLASPEVAEGPAEFEIQWFDGGLDVTF